MGKFKVGVAITEKDLGWKRIRKELEKLSKKPYVKVGVQGQPALAAKKFRDEAGRILESPTMNVVEIATIHEFGAPSANIPERSFIRSTVDEKRDEFRALTDRLYQEILLGKQSTEDALGLLGEAIQAAIQAKFTDNNWAPLSMATLAGRSQHVGNKAHVKEHRPLVDTGQLRQSIRYKKVMSGSDSDD